MEQVPYRVPHREKYMDFQQLESTYFRPLRFVGVASLCWLVGVQCAPGQQAASDSNSEVVQLVKQLHDPAFAIREGASLRLLEIGEAGLVALRNAEADPSIEVRERVGRIRAEVDRLVFEQRAKGFLISGNPQEDFGLPGWSQFRQLVGSSRSSKLLFLEMIRRQRELAVCIAASSQAIGTPNEQAVLEHMNQVAAESAQRLRANMTHGGTLPEIGDAVGLLTAASLLTDQPSIEINVTIVSAMYRGEVGDYFNLAGYGRCMRTLTGKWMPKTQDVIAADILSLGMQKDIPESVVIARKHLGKQSDKDIRIASFQCLARYGETPDIALAEQYLSDETVVHQFEESYLLNRDDFNIEDSAPPLGKPPQLPAGPKVAKNKLMAVRVNDLALAACMSISKEDLTVAFPKYHASPVLGFAVNSIAFPMDNQAAHNAAIESWLKKHGDRVLKSN